RCPQQSNRTSESAFAWDRDAKIRALAPCRRRKGGAACARRLLSVLLPATQGLWYRRRVRHRTFCIHRRRVLRQNCAPDATCGFRAEARLEPRLEDGFDFGQHMIRVFADVHCFSSKSRYATVLPQMVPAPQRLISGLISCSEGFV